MNFVFHFKVVRGFRILSYFAPIGLEWADKYSLRLLKDSKGPSEVKRGSEVGVGDVSTCGLTTFKLFTLELDVRVFDHPNSYLRVISQFFRKTFFCRWLVRCRTVVCQPMELAEGTTGRWVGFIFSGSWINQSLFAWLLGARARVVACGGAVGHEPGVGETGLLTSEHGAFIAAINLFRRRGWLRLEPSLGPRPP